VIFAQGRLAQLFPIETDYHCRMLANKIVTARSRQTNYVWARIREGEDQVAKSPPTSFNKPVVFGHTHGTQTWLKQEGLLV